MSHSQKGSGIGQIIKALVVAFFKLFAIVLAFICKLAGLILTKISEILEKPSGHGNH
jgi:hypothetical protein